MTVPSARRAAVRGLALLSQQGPSPDVTPGSSLVGRASTPAEQITKLAPGVPHARMNKLAPSGLKYPVFVARYLRLKTVELGH